MTSVVAAVTPPVESTDGWPASKLLAAARVWARSFYPESILVSELSVGNWGGARLDLGVITDAEIIGVEIKGDGDSPSRLKLQACVYGRAVTRMWVLPAPSLQARVLGRHKPQDWGELNVNEHSQVTAPDIQYLHPRPLANAAKQLTEILWKDELLEVCAETRVGGNSRCTVNELQDAISENVPLKEVRRAVIGQLWQRDWLGRYDAERISLPASMTSAESEMEAGQ